MLKGRKATSFFAIKDDVVNAGAKWEDAEVVVDSNLVTSRKPEDLPAFCRASILKPCPAFWCNSACSSRRHWNTCLPRLAYPIYASAPQVFQVICTRRKLPECGPTLR